MIRILKKIKDKLSTYKKTCDHDYGCSYLWDFHRGADDGLFMRSARRCSKCGNEGVVTATRMPDEITKLIDASALSLSEMGSQADARNR